MTHGKKVPHSFAWCMILSFTPALNSVTLLGTTQHRVTHIRGHCQTGRDQKKQQPFLFTYITFKVKASHQEQLPSKATRHLLPRYGPPFWGRVACLPSYPSASRLERETERERDGGRERQRERVLWPLATFFMFCSCCYIILNCSYFVLNGFKLGGVFVLTWQFIEHCFHIVL